MRVAFYTLGCKVNQYETSVLMDRFAADGFELTEDHESADVYVINSCTVTAMSDKKCRQAVRRFRRQNPSAIVCLTGCMPQASPEAASRIEEADIVLGASQKGNVLEAVKDHIANARRIVDIVPYHKGEVFEPMRATSFSLRTRAFVKIEDGCDRYCSYCIIPQARGPIRSKKPEDLREELLGLAAGGYQEIVLVGINLSSYGKDMGLRLLDAIRLACSIEGVKRVRLGSLEPELLTDEDIEAMSRLPKLCPQFHLSLQSGCDGTLRRMHRQYDTAEYRRIVDKLRQSFHHCAITTDVMVGFPGETPEEFDASCAFIRDIGFARVHVFAYSRRPGTAADRMPDQISSGEKSRRSKEMIALTETSQRQFLQTQLGRKVNVLFETRLPDNRWEGYCENYTVVRVPSLENIHRKLLPTQILEIDGDGCCGSLL